MVWRARAAMKTHSDGTKQTALVQNGKIYTSSDTGVTWTEATDANGGDDKNWISVAMSR